MNKKKILLAIFILIFIGIAIFYLLRDKGSEELKLYGNVDIREVDLAFEVPGMIAETYYEEGETVPAGAILAKLDQTKYIEKVKARKAEYELQNANKNKFNRGFRPEEIASINQRVAQAQAQLNKEFLLLKRYESLRRIEGISEQDYDSQTANYNQAKANLESLKQDLKLKKSGYRSEDKQAASARAKLSKTNLVLAKEDYDDTILKAPSAGVILTKAKEAGAVVKTGETIYSLSLLKPVWIRTVIDEPNLNEIYPGMKVIVHTDSNKTYQGQIGYISPKAEFTPKTVQTEELRTQLVYRIRVVVENPDQFLRPGLPVTVTLKHQEAEHNKNTKSTEK
jgi:HlyD family secretion protein